MQTLSESLQRRSSILLQCSNDSKFAAAVYEKCRRDIVFWINNFCYTFDPRVAKGSYLPFDLYPRQEQLVAWILDRESNQEFGIVEKSRDVGLSWVCCAVLVHRWLFSEGFVGGIGSRKLDLVDKSGDPSTLFEKIRRILRRLPKWMLPEGFDWSSHSREAILVNPANDNTINGEGGRDIGRGGRSSLYFIDEAAFLTYALEADNALSQNTEVVIYVSTPNGRTNAFAAKRFSGQTPVFTYHWKSDPRHSKYTIVDADGREILRGSGDPPPLEPGEKCIYPWLEKQKRKFAHNPRGFRQEVEIDYNADGEQLLMQAEWVDAMVKFQAEPSNELVAALDPSGDGPDENALIVRGGPTVVLSEGWQEDSGDPGDAAIRASIKALRLRCRNLLYDAGGVGAGIGGTLRRMASPGLEWRGVNFAEAPSVARWPDGRHSYEMFRDMKAEMYWCIRERARKTYLHLMGQGSFAKEELLSIPDDPILITQLKDIRYEEVGNGKIAIEGKRSLANRDAPSPDRADALAISERAYMLNRKARKAKVRAR